MCFFHDHYQSVKWFGARSGSKMFAKFISRRQKLPLARKEFNLMNDFITCDTHSINVGRSTNFNLPIKGVLFLESVWNVGGCFITKILSRGSDMPVCQ